MSERTTIWVCRECGKTSLDRNGERGASYGWDVSCMLNSFEAYRNSIERDDQGQIIRCEIVKAGEA